MENDTLKIPKLFLCGMGTLLFAFGLWSQEIKYPEPLDYQDEAVPETYTQSVWQLESDGKSIYIRTENAYILQIDRAGQLLGVYPIPEEGPLKAPCTLTERLPIRATLSRA